MNIVFPMIGPNKFTSEDYTFPKPLVDIFGKTMLESAFDTYKKIESVRFIPIISSSDVKEFNIDSVVKQIVGDIPCKILTHSGKTSGALCTSLLAIDYLDENEELIIANYDQSISFDLSRCIEEFRSKKADFGVICFDSVHPKWSYVKTDDNNVVVEVAEKKPISRNAMVGFYYFRKASGFINSAMKTMLTAGSDKDRFFISECLNQLVLLGAVGHIYKIDKSQYRNFYDASELKEYLHENKSDLKSKKIFDLTNGYAKYFDSKDLGEIKKLMDDSVSLYDPSVGEIVGIENVSNFVRKLFDDNSNLSFVVKNISVSQGVSFLEFVLVLDGKIVKGVDVISWENNRIKKIVAYLEVL